MILCIHLEFAYHEVSFFLIRLLQKFARFELAEDAQPVNSRPPAEWAKCGGRQGMDKIWPEAGIAMRVKVGRSVACLFALHKLHHREDCGCGWSRLE
jgi:hypothetical protein